MDQMKVIHVDDLVRFKDQQKRMAFKTNLSARARTSCKKFMKDGPENRDGFQ